MSRDALNEPRRKSLPPQPGAASAPVKAPKEGETKPAKTGRHPIGNLGPFAHPSKKGRK